MYKDHTSLILVGGGGHALAVAEAALAAGFAVVGCLDDDPSPLVTVKMGIERLGSLASRGSVDLGASLVLALGEPGSRDRVISDLHPARVSQPIVHPRACVSPTATIEPGVYVGPGAVVHAFVTIRAHAIINSAAVVEHECDIDVNAHIAPGAVLAGRVRVDRGALVGLGSRVLPGLTIGQRATVGAGAVVTHNVPANVKVAGVPARMIER